MKNKKKNNSGMKANPNISCDVSSCDYNNLEEGKCCLNEVSISCDCSRNECSDTSSTICQSFESSGSPITDNVYEVASEFTIEETNYK